MHKFIEHFPYREPRDGQRAILESLEKYWDNYEVFVIVAPVSAGKTAISKAISSTCYSCSMITPTNQLVDQFLDEFPNTPTLSRLDSYQCGEWLQTCAQTKARRMQFCRGCKCSRELSTAKYRRGPGIYNYYTYLSHRLYRGALVIDEAHNVINTLQDRLAVVLWQHDYRYPEYARRPEQLLAWINSLPSNKQKHKKVQFLRECLMSSHPRYIAQLTREWFNGRGTKRGVPEERPCIKLYPVDVSDAPPMFWPAMVEKIVLMSATIGPRDVRDLGLAGRRVLYLEVASPIPPDRRPIQLLDTAYLSGRTLEEQIPRIAAEIENIANYHAGERGFIHVTYQMGELLRPHLTGSRYMFHTRENKREIYQQFREAGGDRVLVASGMYEGVDLPDDLGRWQVITKCPYPSLGDPAIRYRAEKDSEWYQWVTLRDLIQASGRICRHEEDYGATYILDSNVRRLLSEVTHLTPKWFREAIVNL